MDITLIAIITISLMLILVLLGVHVGVVLALLSVVGIYLTTGNFDTSIQISGTTAFHGVRDYIFGVIPLFVLMGLFTNISGINTELFREFNLLLRKVRGGLAMATVGANAIFALMTGVSVASAAVFSKVALNPMTDLNYNKKFALGTIAGSSVLGMLIPPSLLLILYGMLAEVSIGAMFMAGIVPGILLSLVYCIGIYVISLIKPNWVGGNSNEYRSKWSKRDVKDILKPAPLGILVLLVLGGIYGGLFTPTEAAGVGAFGALLLCFYRRKITVRSLSSALIETGYTSASILFLLIAAQMYSRMLSMSGILHTLNEFLSNLSLPPLFIIFIFVFIILLLGMVLDSSSILLICMPIMIPVVMVLGYDLIHFGIISVVAVEMGMLTPPFGMVVYAMKSALGNKVSLEEIFAGSLPFLIMMFIVLLILIFVPELSTWLPSLMH